MDELPQQSHADVDERLEQPFRQAVRGSGYALLVIGVLELIYFVRRWYFMPDAAVYWWIWVALPVFAVAVIFAYAFIAAKAGHRWAMAFIKMVAGIVVAGMHAAVWWSVQPKGSGI